MAATVAKFDFRSMCEQQKPSMYTKRTRCTKFKADWNTLKNGYTLVKVGEDKAYGRHTDGHMVIAIAMLVFDQ